MAGANTTPPTIGYRSFPPEYIRLLELVERLPPDETIPVGPFTKAEALASRRAFYRFRNALHEAPPEDTFAHQLASIAATVAIQVHQDREGSTSWVLSFGVSPFVAAIRRFSLPEHQP